MPNDQSFESTLQSARAGDKSAWERIVGGFNPGLRGYVRSQGVVDIDDLVGEIWLGVVRSLPSFQGGEEPFRSWLYSIAYRRIADEHRRRARRPQVELEDGHFELACGAHESAESTALRRSEDEAVVAALAQLTDDQRQVVSLRFLVGLSPEETARSMGRSVNAVHALQNRAFTQLRKILAATRK